MPTMKGKRNANLQIALPPAVALTIAESGSGASTPGPHTPLPFDYVMAPSAPKLGKDTMSLDEAFDVNLTSARGKRGREANWEEHEVEILENCLLHPPRDSLHFPPGTMPSGQVLDEMTNFVLAAFEPHADAEDDVEPATGTLDDHFSPLQGWRHSWDSTRKKLSDIALTESRLGAEMEERKMTRQEKLSRPGMMRRVNSMDFMDQGDKDEKPSEQMGRVLRLSTTLQNTAKQEPLVMMSRSSSADGLSTNNTPMAITVTPSSPNQSQKAPSMRRSGSFRNTRPARPSLLQRGRSFTASDLQDVRSPPLPVVNLTEEPAKIIISPSDPAPVASTNMLDVRPPSVTAFAPRIARSHSSSAITGPPPHIARDTFLSRPSPSTLDASKLAMPFSPTLSPALSAESVPSAHSSEWDSDSDLESGDRAAKKSRTKLRKAAAMRPRPTKIKIEHAGLQSGGLRSPFEEKLEITF